METWDIDPIDIIVAIGAVIFVASAPTILAAIPALIIWGLQYGIRHTNNFETLRDKHPTVAKYLLPAPSDGEEISTAITLRQDKPIDVNVVNGQDNRLWLQKLTQPIEYDGDPTVVASLTTTRNKKGVQSANMLAAALKVMPRYIKHTVIPKPPTNTSVPVGYDGVKKEWLWADFGRDGDDVHALVAGQTGVGKDAVLRVWFTLLTSLNPPEDIQFVVLDGKGEWLTVALQQSKHMFVRPTGGVEVRQNENGKWIDVANERMEESMGAVFEEITKRNKLFAEVNATDIRSYQRKTNIKLPVIIIIATDVGTNVEKNFEQLVRLLTYKGRSFGIKLIISMQHVSGQDTGWRNQLSLIMSGFQQAPAADTPTMGINATGLIYRPSQLPPPNNPQHKGIFVVRKGGEQSLVKAPHLSEEDWEAFVERALPKNGDDAEANELLTGLLTHPLMKTHKPAVDMVTTNTVSRRVILTLDQLEKIRDMAREGATKTDIMYNMGFTSGPRYKETSPYIDKILRTVKENMLQV